MQSRVKAFQLLRPLEGCEVRSVLHERVRMSVCPHILKTTSPFEPYQIFYSRRL